MSILSLEDRSRHIWLQNADGIGFQYASYCSGMGIWQVRQGGEPMDFSDLNFGSQEIVEDWLKLIDNYVFKYMTDLKEILQ